MSRLVLRPGKEKSLLRRHPWVYASAVARVEGSPDSGATIEVRGADGRFLAWAAFSPASTIRARAWSFAESERVDAGLLTERVRAAIARRSQLDADTDAVRLVFGEADGLPGLIVDRYGGWLVTQFQAAGVESWRSTLVAALVDATGCAGVFDRSDGATRTREGLGAMRGVLAGTEPPARIEIVEHGLRFEVDVRRGHKTGYYIDQRDNRRIARELVAQSTKASRAAPRGLNCFCYTGGFSIAMLAGGAAHVDSIDSSAEALHLGAEHVSLNGLRSECASWREADVFAALRALRNEGASYDLIVLDPPKFASNHHHVDRAARAYKDINLNALRLLAPGGRLLTFSCSGAIDTDLFQKIVAGAVIDSGVDAWMVGRLGAGADHPPMMTVPESEYLKGLHLVRPA
ncbi:MAG TPA: class I SAM-dependent rRNA methyltransferase [Burkholderiaceae bacterium]|nr:class I SAM-dependent rRNA methyltransferase [Burkholderiaceae bacterium]